MLITQDEGMGLNCFGDQPDFQPGEGGKLYLF